MIAQLSGTVKERGLNHVVIDCGGVGYLIYATESTLASLPDIDSEAEILTYLVVRENALDLYGFSTATERTLFMLLLDVSGIGPKSALSVLNVAPAQTLQRAIGANDTSYLTKVSGIGKKTAEKIVLELRDKMAAYATEETSSGLQEESDALEALVSLGYNQQEARDALKQVSSSENTNERIREALKLLGGK